MTRRLSEWIILWTAAAGLAVVMTWPLAGGLDRLGRTDSGDGKFTIWNIAWVARTLVEQPRNVFDANIFYPHDNTLAYSEANLVAGALGVPVYWTTRNPYITANVVLLFAFAASFVCAFALARYVTGSAAASAIAAVCFAFCPFVFVRLPHIQLQMTAGLPLCLLALHRLVDKPTLGRGVLLGLAMALQALACAYYGIFVGITVVYGVLFYAVSRGLWRRPAYWGVTIAGAIVAVGLVLPFFLPYLDVQEKGFSRPLAEAAVYSATWKAYLASSAHAHRWMLTLMVEGWGEALFPGFVLTLLGLTGAWVGLRAPASNAAGPSDAGTLTRRNRRETTAFYASVGLLAWWTSLGPKAGLYMALFYAVPVMSFLRAPARIGIIVVLALAVLAALALARLWREWPAKRRTIAAAALGTVTLLELTSVPLRWRPVPETPPVYRVLAALPAGPVAEFPFFYERLDFPRHTSYMLWSTFHWKPLVNGYSDYIPEDFRAMVVPMSSFPTRASFRLLHERRVRYVTFHRTLYDSRSLQKLDDRLAQYGAYLTPIHTKGDVWLYEIRSWPE